MPTRLALATWLLLTPTTAFAQRLPSYVPANPVLASRSPLYVQPVVEAHAGWHAQMVFDYANAIETSTAVDRRTYLFDAETSQLDIWLGRDLSPAWFVLANLPIRGVHDGFLDAFLNGYHDLIGLPVPARNARPKDSYAWQFTLPDQTLDVARPGTPFLGDVRLAAGYRIGSGQLVVSATLPTATTDVDGWSRGTVGLALSAGAALVSNDRVRVEGSVMAGVTPTHGSLAGYQRSAFVGASAALRWRVIGQQAVYGTFFIQSANWQHTGFAAMETAEVTLDTGVLLRLARHWPALQLGVTEDLVPRGPAVDVAARIGVLW